MISDRVDQCKLSLKTSNQTIVLTMLNDHVNYGKRSFRPGQHDHVHSSF